MKLYQIYFSPTGGTKKVAGLVAGAWHCEKEEIDLLKRGEDAPVCTFAKEDVCMVALPSFGGRAPEPALRQLREMRGGGARAILVAVYGNRDFEDTLLELKDTLEGAGFVSAAAVAAVAEHSIIHTFAAGRPDAKDQEELEGFAAQIRHSLEQAGGSVDLHVPGNRPYREYHGVPMKPSAGKGCTQCGLCARECPVHAIPKDHPESVDKERCISCMHCVAVCPAQVRHNQKLVLLAAEQKMKKSCSGRKENQLFLAHALCDQT